MNDFLQLLIIVNILDFNDINQVLHLMMLPLPGRGGKTPRRNGTRFQPGKESYQRRGLL